MCTLWIRTKNQEGQKPTSHTIRKKKYIHPIGETTTTNINENCLCKSAVAVVSSIRICNFFVVAKSLSSLKHELFMADYYVCYCLALTLPLPIDLCQTVFFLSLFYFYININTHTHTRALCWRYFKPVKFNIC